MIEYRLERFGGAWLLVAVPVEPVSEMLERCRQADAARIADGTQEQYLQAQCAPKRTNWADKYFK